jgi:photosystem II stability/assembly factor-like uncharacterized protein
VFLQDPCGELLGRVDPSELERVVRELSGAETIYIGTVPVMLTTRYALSPEKDLACRYLCDEISGYGYDPIEQLFVLSVARASLTGIEVSVSGDSIWVAEIDGTLYLATADEGWDDPPEIASLAGEIHDLELDSAGRLWAGCGLPNGNLGVVRRSADGGITWESIFSGAQVLSIYDIEINGSNAIAVGANGTVVLSALGGEAWSVVDPFIFRFQSSYGVASSGPMHFWLVTVDGHLFETPNFGVDWFERDLTAGQLNSIDFFGPRHGVIVGDGISFHTADGGETWIPVPVDADLRHVSMADSERVLTGGGAGELYYSRDGGASWSELTGICGGGEQIYRTAVSGSDRFWLAGGNDVRMVEGTNDLDCAVYHYNDTIIGRNISFVHEGSETPEKRILLTAHYDSYSSDYYECAPGADDNATGVSAVLQAARALRGVWTEKSVEFVLFDGEEVGLRGSYHFVSVLDDDVEYEAVINLDMLGYDHNIDRSLVIAGRQDNEADSLIAEFIIDTTADLGLGLYPEFAPGAALSSDHRAFWSLGMPSVLMIEGYRDELTPRYHSCGDIADFIDYGYLELSAKVALSSVALLAGYVTDEPDTLRPATARLGQNWPNPFNDATIVPYYLPRNSMTRLGVYDVKGREVARLFEGVRREGDHEYGWDGRGPGGEKLASGIYFLRLETSAGTDVRKIVILR